jgi:hypothetical protein
MIKNLLGKLEMQAGASEKIAKIALQEQSRGARALEIAIDLGERLKLQLSGDDLRNWPGYCGALLDLDRLKSEFYHAKTLEKSNH